MDERGSVVNRAQLIAENQARIAELKEDNERRAHLRDIGEVPDLPPLPVFVNRLYEPVRHSAPIETTRSDEAAADDDETGLTQVIETIGDEIAKRFNEHRRQSDAKIQELRNEVAELRSEIARLRG
jgi:hypothetical protein